jgi:hypothetical protein
MARRQPHTDQQPFSDPKNPFEHAEVAPSGVAIPSEAEVLKGSSDTISTLRTADENNANAEFESATVSDVRQELHRKETLEDLQYGPTASQTPNEDESSKKADLDLKLLNPNPTASSMLREAEAGKKL